MTPHTIHRNRLKNALTNILKVPEARTVEYRYRTIRGALYEEYPKLIETTDREIMLNFIKDAVYLDRLLRLSTEGEQPLKKKILSQEFQVSQLGYKN
jgi:hypothetical protein